MVLDGASRAKIKNIPRHYPIYCLTWSPDCIHILYSNGGSLEIAPISTSSKNITWKAHGGIVTKVNWDICGNLIASVGEL